MGTGKWQIHAFPDFPIFWTLLDVQLSNAPARGRAILLVGTKVIKESRSGKRKGGRPGSNLYVGGLVAKYHATVSAKGVASVRFRRPKDAPKKLVFQWLVSTKKGYESSQGLVVRVR